jgi:cell division protein FtsN
MRAVGTTDPRMASMADRTYAFMLRFRQRALPSACSAALLVAGGIWFPVGASFGGTSFRDSGSASMPKNHLASGSGTSQSASKQTRPRRVHPENEDPTSKPAPSTSKPAPTGPAAAPAASHRAAGKGVRRRAFARRTKSLDAADKGYTLQLGAFLAATNADRLLQRLAEEGYKAEVSSMTDGHKRVWRLVRIGSYPDRDGARAGVQEIEEKTGIKAIIRPAGRF